MEYVGEGTLREETEGGQPCEIMEIGEVEADMDEIVDVSHSETDLGTLLGEVFGLEARAKAIQMSEGQASSTEADGWAFNVYGHGADRNKSATLAAEPMESPEVIESPELCDVSEEPIEMQSRDEVLGQCVIDAMSDEEEEDEEDYDPFSTEPMSI